MANPVEVLYNLKIAGEADARRAAEAQQLIRKNAEEATAVLKAQDDAAKKTATSLDAAARSAENLASKFPNAQPIEDYSEAAKKASESLRVLGDLVEVSGKSTVERWRESKKAAEDYAAAAGKVPKGPTEGTGSYDPSKAAEGLARAHAILDQAIQKQQLSELSGLQRIEAKRQQMLSELGLDASLREKINSLANAEAAAEQRKQSRAREVEESKQIESARQRVLQLENQMLSPLQRIEQERAKLLAMAKQDEDLQRRINAVFDEQARKQNQNSGFGSSVRNAIQNPLQTAASFAGDLADTLGPAGIAAGVIAIGLEKAATAAFHLVEASGEVAQEIENTSQRIGLSAAETQKLGAAAGLAGVNFHVLEASARLLGNALEDPAGAGKKVVTELDKLGISIYAGNGALKEEGQLLLEVLGRLSQIKTQSELVAAAQSIFARGGKELIPYIKNYDELNEAIRKAGIGTDNDLIPSLSHAERQIRLLDEVWKEFKLKLAEKIAPVVIPVVTTLSNTIANGKGGPQGLASDSGQLQREQDRLFRELTGGKIGPSASGALALGNSLASQLQSSQAPLRDAITKFRAEDDRTLQGLQERKANLEKEIKDERFRLRSGGFSDAGDFNSASSKLKQDEADLAAVEKQIKALNKTGRERDHLATLVEAAEKRANEFELTGIQKIVAARDELNKKLAGRPDLIRRSNAAAELEIAQQSRRDQIGLLGATTPLNVRRANFGLGPDQEKDAAQNEFRIRIENATKLYGINHDAEEFLKSSLQARIALEEKLLAIDERRLQNARQTAENVALEQVRSQQAINERRIAFTDPQARGRRATEDDTNKAILKSRLAAIDKEQAIKSAYEGKEKADAEARLARIKAQEEFEITAEDIKQRKKQEAARADAETARAALQHAAQLVELQTGSGGELAAIERIAAIKHILAEREFRDSQNQAEFEKQQADIEYERTAKILELRKRELESFKAAAGELFDAIEQRGSQGARDFFRNLGQREAKQIVENLAGIGFESIRKSITTELPGQTKQVTDPVTGKTVDQPTLLGRILGGTLFGVKPQDHLKNAQQDHLIQSTGDNTQATRENTDALKQITTYLASPGSGFGGTGTFAGDVQSALSGVTGQQTSAIAGAILGGANGKISIPGISSGTTDIDSAPSGVLGQRSAAIGNVVLGGPNGQISIPGLSSSSSSTSIFNSLAGAHGFGGQVSAALGIAGAGFGAFNGISQISKGGAANIAGGIGTTALSVAPLTGPAAPFVALGGAILEGISKLFGNNRETRERDITRELANDKFNRPDAVNTEIDSSGRAVSRDYQGNLRVLDAAPRIQFFNQAVGFDPLHPDQVVTKLNGYVGTAPIGAPATPAPPTGGFDFTGLLNQANPPSPATVTSHDLTPQIQQQAPRSSAPIVQQTVQLAITAMDSKSILDRSDDIGNAMKRVLQSTHSFNAELDRVVNPR